MLVLKRFKNLRGSSILESIIAIVIISVCVLVAFTIYINVVKRNDPLAYYNGKQKIEWLTYEATLSKNYEEDSYKYDNYTLIKKVQIREDERTVLLDWTIKTTRKDYNVKKIIPYSYE